MNILSVTDLAKRYVGYASNFQRFASWFGVPVTPLEEFWPVKNISFSLGAEAQSKKLLRIHTAGPNDTNVDNTKLAVEFAENANKAASSVDVRVFPASQLGQTREVIEAMRLGSGAAGTTVRNTPFGILPPCSRRKSSGSSVLGQGPRPAIVTTSCFSAR